MALAESPAKNEFRKNITNKPAKTYTKRATPISDLGSAFVKMLLYGNSGTGKTFALGQLANAGFKLVGFSTDFGENGMLSVFNYLKKVNPAAQKNILNVDLSSFEEVQDFTEDPTTFCPNLYEFDPDFLFWDGFSSYQQGPLSEYVAEKAGGDDATKFQSQDWGSIRTGSVRPLNRFFGLHNPYSGKKYSKIVTALQDKAKDDKITKETLIGPLVQGSAYSLMAPMCDLIIQLSAKNRRDEDNASARDYFYTTSGNERILAKNRGFDLEPVEPGDMAKLWAKIKAQLGNE